MFRNRTKTLVRRLWKARLEEGRDEGPGAAEDVRAALLRRLQENELQVLLAAVEGRSGTAGCVRLRSPGGRAHLLACRTWRWPDLHDSELLRRLPSCQTSSPGATCCNPYHWSRLYQPESPPPPYSRFASERLRPEDRAPSETSGSTNLGGSEMRGSLSTHGEGDSNQDEWCKLAYWELSQRIGRQFPVITQSIHIFWSLPYGEEGLCLASLASKHNQPTPEMVRKARDKIGRGAMLSRESDGVWLYNMSECPMFINSPSLDDPDSMSLMVYRLPPGYCLNIVRNPLQRHTRTSRPHIGPIDPNSVRISFSKGWGPKYSRQEITACPTWLEILLTPPHPPR